MVLPVVVIIYNAAVGFPSWPLMRSVWCRCGVSFSLFQGRPSSNQANVGFVGGENSNYSGPNKLDKNPSMTYRYYVL